MKFEAITAISALYEEAHGAYWIGAWVDHTALPSVKGKRSIYIKFSQYCKYIGSRTDLVYETSKLSS